MTEATEDTAIASKLRIVTWNCHMGIQNKVDQITDLDADLLVIQECANDFGQQLGARSYAWQGNNPRKGIGIAALSEKLKIDELENPVPEFWWTLPVKAEGAMSFNLIGVWSFASHRQPSRSYFHEAISGYEDLIRDQPTIIIGDFNNNVRWDTKAKPYHKQAVEWMKERGLVSLYHHQENEEQGEETQATYFHTWDLQKPYHIDYCFAPKQLVNRGAKISAGNPDQWLKLSDHVPLVIDIPAAD